MRRRWHVTTVLFAVASVAACQATGSDGVLEIQVLSNRADLLSGGDALVDIVLSDSADLSGLQVSLDGEDVSSMFALRPNGRVQGLVTGLPVGESTLTATLGGSGHTRITLTNHPIGGPIFAGPQVQPWVCRTEKWGFGPSIDTQCNAPSKVEFFYRSTESDEFQPYDAANPPADVAETTTDQGVTVPHIIRREQGTLNRGTYSFAVLFNPSAEVSPWEPPAAWNGKVLYMFGGSLNPLHYQASPGSVLIDRALPRGFVVARTSLNILDRNSNSVVSAEAVMMLKEHIAETIGPIRYTIGWGSSGGALQQQFLANAYPGLLDGIRPADSWPDVWGVVPEVNDCSLLVRYFKSTSPAMWEDVRQRNAVMDNANELPGTCESLAESVFPAVLGDPTIGCWLGPWSPTPEWVYHAETNPEGARCTQQDYQVAMFGTRPDGFANRPYDNVGAQYGLLALDTGIISPEQFVDLNEKVGGFDIDFIWMAERTEADPMALDVVYRTGQLNLGLGMNTVPTIDLRLFGNYEMHSRYHTWVMRARVAKTHGSADNHVVLLSPPDPEVEFDLMDRWVAAIKADASEDPLPIKVVRNKPAEAVDACWIEGERVTDMERCLEANPYFGNARLGAGQALDNSVMKCQLKPLDRSSYSVTFTDDQWARMEAAFPGGVCDWTLPSVGYTAAIPWLSFADGPGGQPLGAAPVSMVISN